MVPGVELKQCQSGTKIVPFWKKGSCFQPFFENSSPRGAILKNSALLAGGAVLFLNMIMKEKNSSLFQKGTIFQNGSLRELFWLPFFSQ